MRTQHDFLFFVHCQNKIQFLFKDPFCGIFFLLLTSFLNLFGCQFSCCFGGVFCDPFQWATVGVIFHTGFGPTTGNNLGEFTDIDPFLFEPPIQCGVLFLGGLIGPTQFLVPTHHPPGRIGTGPYLEAFLGIGDYLPVQFLVEGCCRHFI